MIRSLALLNLVFACALLAQTSPVPYDPVGGGPTFSSAQLNYSYKGVYSSIGAVDFSNFTFDTGRPGDRFSLKNGSYEHRERFSYEEITLDSVHYLGGSEASPLQSALVLLTWSVAAGSSNQEGIGLVFRLSKNRLRVVQRMSWDTHFQASEPTSSFDPRTNTLVVRTAHYLPGDAHCCVSAMDVITLHWLDSHFVQTGIKTELTEYGRVEGKTLAVQDRVTYPACSNARCSGRQIDDNLGILRFCVPRGMKVEKAFGEHGDLHYSVSFKWKGQRHTLYIVSGPYFTGRGPRDWDPFWSVRHWQCADFKGEDYRVNRGGRHARYVTLNAPMGYATYKDLPAEVASRFDRVLDSLCCGACTVCAPK